MTVQEYRLRQVASHELYGDFWFNSDPVPIAALRGRVILLDFWDYSDGSCLRGLPYVREWHRRYAPYGLVVVGVHTPKFPFGKDPRFVERAIRREQIMYPVVMDNESLIWSSYGNRAWPTRQLIDKEGFVRCAASGEGGYSAMEQIIHSLLYGAGVTEELPLIMGPVREADRSGAVVYRSTPELFTGYVRGTVGNVEAYAPESVVEYVDPGLYLEGRVYLAGKWLNGRNNLRYRGDPGIKGYILVNYAGVEAGAVLGTEDEPACEVEILQDHRYLTEQNRGDDITIGEDGRSTVKVEEPRYYALVRNREFGEHLLKLGTLSTSCLAYSFSFVSGVIPELVSNG